MTLVQLLLEHQSMYGVSYLRSHYWVARAQGAHCWRVSLVERNVAGQTGPIDGAAAPCMSATWLEVLEPENGS